MKGQHKTQNKNLQLTGGSAFISVCDRGSSSCLTAMLEFIAKNISETDYVISSLITP